MEGGSSHGRIMAGKGNGAGEGKRAGGMLISQRFAVIVIAIIFGASMAGWIATEFVPPDFLEREALFVRAWGQTGAKFVETFRLYDPFHSFWYRFILALFFVVLFLCVITRWRQLALRSWRHALPADAHELRKREPSFEFSWRLLDGGAGASKDPLVHYAERYARAEHIDSETLRGRFMRIAARFKKAGFAIISREDETGVSFTAFTGRWRSPGAMLFHIGILVITIGGVIGSYGGWREMMLVREGATVPFPRDSSLALRVDRFDIVMTRRLEIKDFISTISILGSQGDTLAAGTVEVNRPMKVAGRRIYQSEFQIDESTFKRARIGYSLRGDFRRGTLDFTPGVSASIDDSMITVTALRFIPDFRMSPDGPFSASALPSNPALQVEVAHAGMAERGWLFLYHPDFGKRFTAPVDLTLEGCEPVYYTGLEVSASPGANVLLAGFAAATLGLLLMYLSNPRVIKGRAGTDALIVAGTEYRWRASFEREFAAIREAMRQEFGSRR
jgi:cytochrome c biogenesis protein